MEIRYEPNQPNDTSHKTQASRQISKTSVTKTIRALVSGIALLLIGMLTDPSSTHPIVLIAAFILVFSTIYFSLRALTDLIPSLASRARRRQRMVAASVSGVLTLVLLLQSIGQLTVRDVATVAIFCGLLYFYVSKFGNSYAD
jgi:hypothetical membrane protein